MSAPCGVPKTRSNGPANAACSRSEKIPPPSLLTTTRHRSGRGSSGPSSRPGRSCRNARSPRSATAGPPPAAWCASAAPIAEDTSPSMPLAPRLASTRIPARGAMCRSRSRTGRLDAAHSSAPAGSAAARSRASRGSLSARAGSRIASAAPRAAALGAQPRREPARPRSRPGPGRPGQPAPPRRRSVAVRAGSAQRPGPCASTTCRGGGAPGRPRRNASWPRDSPGRPAETMTSGRCSGDESRGAEQVAVGRQRVRAAPGVRRRLGQHRPPRRLGQLEQRRGVVVPVPADHHPPLGPLQPQPGVRGLPAPRPRRRQAGPRRPARPPVERLRPGRAPRPRASGTSGSRSGTLTCTGPGTPPASPDAIAHARQASDRQ